jgi:hypothetical protein
MHFGRRRFCSLGQGLQAQGQGAGAEQVPEIRKTEGGFHETGSRQGGEILMSKKLFCSDASCIKGILQALCHVLEIALSRGFEAHERAVGCTA